MNAEFGGRATVALRRRPDATRTASEMAPARFFCTVPVSLSASSGSGFAASASSNENAIIGCTFRFFGRRVLSSASKSVSGYAGGFTTRCELTEFTQERVELPTILYALPGGSHHCKGLNETQLRNSPPRKVGSTDKYNCMPRGNRSLQANMCVQMDRNKM